MDTRPKPNARALVIPAKAAIHARSLSESGIY